MLGWITSLYDLIAGFIGFFVGIFDRAVSLTQYAIGFCAAIFDVVQQINTSFTWLSPVLFIGGIFVSLAITRLIVSFGGIVANGYYITDVECHLQFISMGLELVYT